MHERQSQDPAEYQIIRVESYAKVSGASKTIYGADNRPKQDLLLH